MFFSSKVFDVFCPFRIFNLKKCSSMSNISGIIDTLKNLIEVRLELIKREFKKRVTSIITRLAVLVLMGLTALFILVFASFSLGFYFSDLTRSPALGFLMVAGVYLLLFVVLFFIRNSLKLQANLRNSFIKYVFSGKEKKDHE